MPAGFVHATFDLMAFGRHYFELHKQKDAPWQELGADHRSLNHTWYNARGVDWELQNPFPKALHSVIESIADKRGDAEAEAAMAVHVAHDYMDRVSDGLAEPERKYITAFCLWLLFNPDVLKNKFGVDVVNETIERTIEGERVWEHAPGLAKKYEDLYRYGCAVVYRDRELASLLARYG